jgi:putative CocE/NonD family hydrolase
VIRHLHELVPARDGARLATDVYLPARADAVPAVLQRTPYGKLGAANVAAAEWWAAHGYASIVQDVRGRHDSDGVWEPYGLHEGPDGADTIEWIARQPWSGGAVAAAGSSYGAFAAFMAALEGPPALKAVVARVPATGLYHHHFYSGGVFSLVRLAWGTLVGRRVQQEVPGDGTARGVFDTLVAEMPDIVLHLPVADIGDRFPMRIPWWRTWLEHQTEDAYWRAREVLHRLDRLRIPVYHIGGWHDDFVSVPPANFTAARAEAPAGFHRLLMGMWPHALNERPDYGGCDYGPEAVIDLRMREKRWLDRWLRDQPDALAGEPPVRLFLMGPNEWRGYAGWPPETTTDRPLYLRAAGQLSFDPPPAAEPADGYRYDPGRPTPQPWDFGEWDMPALPGWPLDPAPRPDRLLYASPPLSEPLAVIGSVRLRLHAAPARPTPTGSPGPRGTTPPPARPACSRTATACAPASAAASTAPSSSTPAPSSNTRSTWAPRPACCPPARAFAAASRAAAPPGSPATSTPAPTTTGRPRAGPRSRPSTTTQPGRRPSSCPSSPAHEHAGRQGAGGAGSRARRGASGV